MQNLGKDNRHTATIQQITIFCTKNSHEILITAHKEDSYIFAESPPLDGQFLYTVQIVADEV